MIFERLEDVRVVAREYKLTFEEVESLALWDFMVACGWRHRSDVSEAELAKIRRKKAKKAVRTPNPRVLQALAETVRRSGRRKKNSRNLHRD